MKQHVNHVTSTCISFYHLRWLRQLRQHVSQAAMKQLMSVTIAEQLGLLQFHPSRTSFFNLRPTTACSEHHCSECLGAFSMRPPQAGVKGVVLTPIIYHIKFKISLLMYLAHMHCCPSYMSQILSSVSNNPFHQWLHSTDCTECDIPRTNTKLGERAFPVSGPLHWNSLPESVRVATESRSFNKILTRCFN